MYWGCIDPEVIKARVTAAGLKLRKGSRGQEVQCLDGQYIWVGIEPPVEKLIYPETNIMLTELLKPFHLQLMDVGEYKGSWTIHVHQLDAPCWPGKALTPEEQIELNFRMVGLKVRDRSNIGKDSIQIDCNNQVWVSLEPPFNETKSSNALWDLVQSLILPYGYKVLGFYERDGRWAIHFKLVK